MNDLNDLKDPKKKTTDENQPDSHSIEEHCELSDTNFAEDSCELLIGWSHNGWMNHGGGGGDW